MLCIQWKCSPIWLETSLVAIIVLIIDNHMRVHTHKVVTLTSSLAPHSHIHSTYTVIKYHYTLYVQYLFALTTKFVCRLHIVHCQVIQGVQLLRFTTTFQVGSSSGTGAWSLVYSKWVWLRRKPVSDIAFLTQQVLRLYVKFFQKPHIGQSI